MAWGGSAQKAGMCPPEIQSVELCAIEGIFGAIMCQRGNVLKVRCSDTFYINGIGCRNQKHKFYSRCYHSLAKMLENAIAKAWVVTNPGK